jgi:hypothetical protein
LYFRISTNLKSKLRSEVLKAESVENGATSRNAGVIKVYTLLKLALVFPYSAENGASNSSSVKFSFDIHLNMARPIGTKVSLGFKVN